MSADLVTSSDWASILTAITTQINVGTVVEVLAVVAGACVGLVFMWWGVKKAITALMKAFASGRLKLK